MNYKKISLIIIVVLIIAGTIFDYQITETLSGKFLIFSKLFEVVGDLPLTVGGTILLLYFGVLNLKADKFGLKIIGLLFYIAGVIVSILIFLFIFKYANSGHGNHSAASTSQTQKIIAVVLGLIFAALLSFRYCRNDYKVLNKHKRKALFALVMLATVIISANLIKIIWGRPRFWLITSGEAVFIPWYVPKPFAKGNEYKSFISGHTANASLMILITLLPVRFIQENKRGFHIFAVLWALLTALSRLFAGQHFLTDVVFAILFVGTMNEVLKKKFGLSENEY